jgi:3-phenylpropionate/trans-cinnamate dioxygenase ferredoxin reductase component
VLRGSVESHSWSALYVRDGYLLAVLAVNRPRDLLAGRRLVGQRIPLSAEQLAEEGRDLKSLLPRVVAAAQATGALVQ